MKNFKKIFFGLLFAGAIFMVNPENSKAEKIIINHELTQGVNVRSEKSNYSSIIGAIDYQDFYDVKDEDDEWYKINYDGKDAYVGKKWFFKLEDYKLTKDSDLKIDRNTKAKTVKNIKNKESITLLDIYSDDYAKVIYKDKIAYISIRDTEIYRKKYKEQNKIKGNIKNTNKTLKKYEDFGQIKDYHYKNGNFIKDKSIREKENPLQDDGMNFDDENISYEYFEVSGDGADIYWYASNFLGNPYVFGGNDLLHGIDCSGFTQQVFREFGIELPRIAQDQYYVGYDVKLGEEKCGDLVFYGNSTNSISHVAIADGNGGIIHAANPNSGIITSYIGNPIAIKRIIEEE